MDNFRLIGSFLLLWTAVTANIQLVGNGYEGVLVSISADVDVNPDLLTTLESILTEGSATLFEATKNQLYFSEFIIVLPENWPTEDHYEDALDFELNEGNIIIAKSNEAQGFTPYVMMFDKCGLGGRFMHLTPTYILDDSVKELYGSPGKVIVHEWAHLRFGVFDEYATTEEEMFYRLGDTWYPTRCTSEVDGELKNLETGENCELDTETGLPIGNCIYVPFPDTPAVASLMDGQYLENVVEFCDDANTAPDHLKHNKFADNQQNRFCQYRSAWEVMRQHQDFISLSNQTALPSDTDTQPRFRYVQAHPRRRVFVLDTSGSMFGEPLVGLRLATSSFILGTVETGSSLGIVQFSSEASRLSPLREINSDEDREALVNSLPSSVNGLTSIGAGLAEGLLVLREAGFGGSLILITDGAENIPPYIEEVVPYILQAGVVVHSLSFGQAADLGIANLSSITGGRAFFYSGSADSTALLDGLTDTVTTGNSLLSNENVPITILTEAKKVTLGNPLVGTFYIDSTIGKDTTLTFSFIGFIEVDLESPDGPYSATNVNEYSSFDSPDKVLRVVLENNLTPGLWSYTVTTTNISEVSVLVNIQSKPRLEGQEVIQTNSWLSQEEDVTFSRTATLGVFAEITRGRTPVLDATVIATVEAPSSTFDLVLLDSGIGNDIIKADGIYSTNIIATDFSDDGRYNVKIKVVGTEEHTRVFVAGTGSASKAARPPLTDGSQTTLETEALEGFQRTSAAGEFRLNGYIPLVGDEIAPGRIVDFHAAMFDSTVRAVTLEWTAVGGDMDRGQAAAYSIYKSADVDDLLTNSTSVVRVSEGDVLEGNLFSPLAAGEREEFVVFVQEIDDYETETIFLAISAVDEAGNEGELSNLVIVSDAIKVAVVRLNDTSTTDGSDSDSDSSTNEILIILICCSVAFVVITIIVVVILAVKSKKAKTVTPFAP